MKHMYEIKEDYQRALDNLQIDPDTGEVTGTEALEAMEGEIDEKIEAFACYIKDTIAFADDLDAERKNLYARQKAMENKAEYLKKRLASFMDSVGRAKFETTKCRVSFRKSTKAIILDETKIPKEYIKIVEEEKVDTAGIKAVLIKGGEVAGATLQESRNIQIK